MRLRTCGIPHRRGNHEFGLLPHKILLAMSIGSVALCRHQNKHRLQFKYRVYCQRLAGVGSLSRDALVVAVDLPVYESHKPTWPAIQQVQCTLWGLGRHV